MSPKEEQSLDDVRIVPVGTLYDQEKWMRCITYKVHAETDLGGHTQLELMLLHRRPDEQP